MNINYSKNYTFENIFLNHQSSFIIHSFIENTTTTIQGIKNTSRQPKYNQTLSLFNHYYLHCVRFVDAFYNIVDLLLSLLVNTNTLFISNLYIKKNRVRERNKQFYQPNKPKT